MSELSEEEIIKKVDNFLDGERLYNTKTGETIIPYEYGECTRFVNKEYYYAIQGLLDLYQKEKKKNKELEDADLKTVYMNGFYDGEKKWKDKIGKHLEELDDIENDYSKKIIEAPTSLVTGVVQYAFRELLEERN